MSTNETPNVVVISLEGNVWQPGSEWSEAIAHAAERFTRVAPLDPETILAHETFAQQVEAFEQWASEANANLDQLLGRYLDEHLALHLRPNSEITRAVRSQANEAEIHLASALPPRAAESIARHCGIWRSVTKLHANLRSPQEIEKLSTELNTQDA